MRVIEGFRGRLRQAINASGKSKYAVGKEAGLERGHLDHIVSGKRKNVSAETLVKLRGVLGVSIDWLLTGEGESKVVVGSSPRPDVVELVEQLATTAEGLRAALLRAQGKPSSRRARSPGGG